MMAFEACRFRNQGCSIAACTLARPRGRTRPEAREFGTLRLGTARNPIFISSGMALVESIQHPLSFDMGVDLRSCQAGMTQ